MRVMRDPYMLEDCGMIIIDMGNPYEVITSDYLDAMYCQVHNTMYSNQSDYDDYQVTHCLQLFVRKVCLHLRSQAGIPTITRTEIHIRGGLSPLSVKFILSTNQEVVMRTLGIGYPSPFYQFDPLPSNQYIQVVYGSDKIGPAIQQELGWRDCVGCHYSDVVGHYCGLGMQMYTGKCMKRVPVQLYA